MAFRQYKAIKFLGALTKSTIRPAGTFYLATQTHIKLPYLQLVLLPESIMNPTTSRDFQRAALQRLNTAEILLKEKRTLEAQYLGGYVVECSLKALILHLTPETEKEGKLERISTGASMHKVEVLLGEIRHYKVELPNDIAARLRRFNWSTDLRYETGRRDTGETIAFLKTARIVHDWVKGQLP